MLRYVIAEYCSSGAAADLGKVILSDEYERRYGKPLRTSWIAFNFWVVSSIRRRRVISQQIAKVMCKES